jgi:hypothetical protein
MKNPNEWTIKEGWLIRPDGAAIIPLANIPLEDIRRLMASLNVYRDVTLSTLEEVAGDEEKRQSVLWWGSQGLLMARRRERGLTPTGEKKPSRLHLAIEKEN